jgi:endonuclease/exonuclease/phosphatase family metal-dependent hydrolase
MRRKAYLKPSVIPFIVLALFFSGCGPVAQSGDNAAKTKRPKLKVLTLNIAHGRGVSIQPFKQVMQKKKTIEKNLGEIAAVIRRENADIVALQEADGPSIWSGNFNHVEKLAELAGYGHHFRGEHMKATKRLSYGTALLSHIPLASPESYRFERSVPTPRKGFVVATVTVWAFGNREVDVVSVHLDFLRKGARNKQIKLLSEKLRGRKRPLIIMGDMNCEMAEKEDSLNMLCSELNLHAWEPSSKSIPTFSSKKPKKRLDWILISEELEFISCRTIPDKVSDHLGVIAEIALKSGD